MNNELKLIRAYLCKLPPSKIHEILLELIYPNKIYYPVMFSIYVEGLSISETADTLNLSDITIKRRNRKGLELLKDNLKL